MPKLIIVYQIRRKSTYNQEIYMVFYKLKVEQLCITLHVNSFLTLLLLSMPKLLIFRHTLTHQNVSGNIALEAT